MSKCIEVTYDVSKPERPVFRVCFDGRELGVHLLYHDARRQAQRASVTCGVPAFAIGPNGRERITKPFNRYK